MVRIQEEGKIVDIPIKAGEMFLLPGGVPHSPQRTEGSVGLVIEKVRKGNEVDAFLWFCEKCDAQLYREELELTDIVAQLPPLMQRFYNDEEKRTCPTCGTVMEPPAKK